MVFLDDFLIAIVLIIQWLPEIYNFPNSISQTWHQRLPIKAVWRQYLFF